MQVTRFSVLQPRDMYGNVPDGRKILVRDSTINEPAQYYISRAEYYESELRVRTMQGEFCARSRCSPIVVDTCPNYELRWAVQEELLAEVTKQLRSVLETQIQQGVSQ